MFRTQVASERMSVNMIRFIEFNLKDELKLNPTCGSNLNSRLCRFKPDWKTILDVNKEESHGNSQTWLQHFIWWLSRASYFDKNDHICN